MYKLKMVVADPDENYVKSLCYFIQEEQTRNIIVISFTVEDSFKKYLASGEKIDLLLISPQLMCSQAEMSSVGITVVLSDTDLNRYGDFLAVYKYQNGDRLMSQLIDIYAENNRVVEKIFEYTGNTRVVSVYSPCGGTGKSTVALNLAIYGSLLGNTVFYLNLEPVSTTLFMLNGQGQKSLSNILLNLKDDKSVLPAKIQAARIKDIKYNIDFFLPPESGVEISGLDEAGTGDLILNLKKLGNYDLIVIDIEASLNEKNISVFKNSDRIVLVTTQDNLNNYKVNIFYEEIVKMGLKIDHKITPIINKYKRGTGDFLEDSPLLKLPIVEDIIVKNVSMDFVEFNRAYSVEIANLLSCVLE
ncbi:MAG: hypothetical protein ACOY46_20125 [Bacillota bacterium]